MRPEPAARLRFAVAALALMLIAAPAAAVTVFENYHVDPNYESGGYYEFEIVNDSGQDLYFFAAGNFGAVATFTRPDLVNVWSPDYCYPESWGPDCPSF